jgi:hypothetical protein
MNGAERNVVDADMDNRQVTATNANSAVQHVSPLHKQKHADKKGKKGAKSNQGAVKNKNQYKVNTAKPKQKKKECCSCLAMYSMVCGIHH